MRGKESFRIVGHCEGKSGCVHEGYMNDYLRLGVLPKIL